MIQKNPVARKQESPAKNRCPILIEMFSNGRIRVYGDKDRINPRIIQRPHVTFPSAGLVTDLLIESVLPHRFRELYRWPLSRLADVQPERITTEQLRERAGMLELLHCHGTGETPESTAQFVLEALTL